MFEQLSALPWAEIGVAVGAIIFAANVIAKITPTQTDDKVMKAINRVASVIGIKVKDNHGQGQ